MAKPLADRGIAGGSDRPEHLLATLDHGVGRMDEEPVPVGVGDGGHRPWTTDPPHLPDDGGRVRHVLQQRAREHGVEGGRRRRAGARPEPTTVVTVAPSQAPGIDVDPDGQPG